ncbi:MAG: hypothetical protein NVSMB46_09610 [Candidatus Saccharimonadales bacterium]
MRTVESMLDAALKIDIPYQIQLALINSAEDFVSLQQSQLLRGERSDGTPIFNVKTGSTEYSPSYAKRKGKSSPIDLYDKGDFSRGIFLQVEDPVNIIIDSADSKSGILQENYGQEIFGLDDTSKVEFQPIAELALLNNIKMLL